MRKPKLKTMARFETEADERAFWAEHDTTEYFDWSQERRLRKQKA